MNLPIKFNLKISSQNFFKIFKYQALNLEPLWAVDRFFSLQPHCQIGIKLCAIKFEEFLHS